MWGPSPKGWGFWHLRAFQLFLSKTQVQLLFRSTEGDGWSAPSCKIRDRSLFLWKPPTMWVTWSPSTWWAWRRFKPHHEYSASQTTCPQTCSIPSSVRVSGFQKISSRSLTTLPWSPTSLQAHQLTNKGEKNLLRPNADFDSKFWAGSAAAAWCSWRPSPPRRGEPSKMMSCCLTWPTSLSSSPLWSMIMFITMIIIITIIIRLTFHSDELALNLANISITETASQSVQITPKQIIVDFQRTFVTLVLPEEFPFREGRTYNMLVNFSSTKRRGNQTW